MATATVVSTFCYSTYSTQYTVQIRVVYLSTTGKSSESSEREVLVQKARTATSTYTISPVGLEAQLLRAHYRTL
jgi:hypothetical protein